MGVAAVRRIGVAVTVVMLAASCSSGGGETESDSGTPSEDATPSEDQERDFSAVDRAIADYVAANDLNGAGLVVVERDEGSVHEHYLGELDADRVSLIASSSKVLSAGVLLRLVDQGLLDLDAPIVDQVDWEGDSAITPAQLLSNSSGLVGLLPDPTYSPYLCQYLSSGAGSLSECGETILLTDEDDADVLPPDTEFQYGGGQWQVAGAVAEVVSGKTWSELVTETYVEPCGVDSLAYTNPFTQLPSADPFAYPPGFDGDPSVLEPTDNPNIEAGAYINAADYAELLLMHLRGGTCGDTEVLSGAAIEAMQRDRLAVVYEGTASVEGVGRSGSDQGYGMGWWIDRETGVIDDPGSFGAVAMLDVEQGYGAYLVIEDTSQAGLELFDLIAPLVEAAVAGEAPPSVEASTTTTLLPAPDRPFVIAHRGASGYAPEHTFAAYDLAVEQGADYLELDVVQTTDGALVVIHDTTLDRTARGPSESCTGAAVLKTLAQLADCDMGTWFNEEHPDHADAEFAGLTLPTVDEVFERYGTDVRYYIEVKDVTQSEAIGEELVAAVGDAGLVGDRERLQVIIQSFSPDALKVIAALDADLPLVQLLSGSDPGVDAARLADIATYADGVGPSVVLVDEELVRVAHENCLVVHPYTIDDPEQMDRLLDLGVDGMFTNTPDVLAERSTGRALPDHCGR